MGDRNLSNGLMVGAVHVPGRVWLAPMTGVSDLPFRQVASACGAPYVATEMVACEQLAAARPDMVRRAAVGQGLPLMVVQLVGGDPHAVAVAARIAAAGGAEIIDLNFGCPAKTVTGIACGSALMRDPRLAASIVAAAVDSVGQPVSVKMRLGWDDASRNAPEVAARAQAAGAKAITVHARTRGQFYGGAADWEAVKAVKSAISIPLLINGDIIDLAGARRALRQSGADGVMIGRGAMGRPWLAAALQAGLEGHPYVEPDRGERLKLVVEHRQASLGFYGQALGGRMFRKHLAAYIDAAPWPSERGRVRIARADLCRLDDTAEIASRLKAHWSEGAERMAA